MLHPTRSRRLSVRRLLPAVCLTTLLIGFYPAILFEQPWAIPVGLALAFASALLLGWPVAVQLHRRRWNHCWQFALAGGLCALPGIALYAAIGAPRYFEPFSAANAAIMLGCGAAGGIVFWLLAVAGETVPDVRALFGLGPVEPAEGAGSPQSSSKSILVNKPPL